MEIINVPGPPRNAFNKNRRVSDLIRAQVAHLKHLEHNLHPEKKPDLPQHAIVTEQDAAIYIASMTRLLRGVNAVPIPLKQARPSRAPVAEQQAIALAAAAEEQPKRRRRKATSGKTKRAAKKRGNR
jgi:hypothetical protein